MALLIKKRDVERTHYKIILYAACANQFGLLQYPPVRDGVSTDKKGLSLLKKLMAMILGNQGPDAILTSLNTI